jgi:ribosomal protein S18 acetylase RimI-like enzyme
MQLPIAPQSYRPGTDALIRAVKRTWTILGRVVADEQQLDTATVFVNPDRPLVRSANFATDVQGSPDEALAYFETHHLPCHIISPSDAQWSDDVQPPVGYALSTRHVMLLDRYHRPNRLCDDLQVVPIRAIYPQLRPFYERFARVGHGADDALAEQLAGVMIDRLDEPRLELFVGRIDKQPVAVAGVIALGDIGVISPAWTDPAHRRKGIAQALMDYTLDHCSRAQFESVVIDRGDGCSSIAFYESLGFKIAGSYARYLRAAQT